jgi:hypothetical protein
LRMRETVAVETAARSATARKEFRTNTPSLVSVTDYIQQKCYRNHSVSGYTDYFMPVRICQGVVKNTDGEVGAG